MIFTYDKKTDAKVFIRNDRLSRQVSLVIRIYDFKQSIIITWKGMRDCRDWRCLTAFPYYFSGTVPTMVISNSLTARDEPAKLALQPTKVTLYVPGSFHV